MIPIHLKNSGLQGYRSSEIGSNLEQFLDPNCDGRDW